MKKIQLTQKKWLQRFLRGTFWHSMGLIFSRALNLVLGFVLARMLGKQGFGTYGFFQTSVQKASAIAGLGLGLATTKHVAEFRSNPTRLGGVVTLAMLFVFVGGSSIGALMYLNADAIALRFDSKIDPPYVQLAGVTVLFAVVTLVFANVMSGLEAFRRNMLVQLCSSLVTFGLVVGAANWYGIDGAIKGLLLSLVFSASLYTVVVLYTLVQLKTVFSIKNAIAERSIILHYSMPSFLSGIVVVITDWIAESMVIIHAGFATYGLYVAANQFSMVITSLNGMFGAVLLPVFISTKSGAAGETSQQESSELDFFNLMFPWTFAVLVIGMVVLPAELWANLLGEEFDDPGWTSILGLVLFSASVRAHRQGILRIILEKGLMWLALIGNFIYGGLVLLFAYLFREHGAVGLALALAIAFLVNTVIVCSVFYYLKLVPGYFLFSRQALAVWGGLIGICIVPWVTESFAIEKLGTTICYLVSVAGLLGLWRKRAQLI